MTHQPKALSPVTLGFVFAILSAALFALRPVLVKLVYDQGVDPVVLITLRMAFSFPIYLLLLLITWKRIPKAKRPSPKVIVSVMSVGCLGYWLASFLDLLGLQYVSAQLGRLLLYSYPTFVVLFGALFFRHPFYRSTLIALALTYLGIALIFGHDLQQFGESIWIGAAFIVACAVSFAFYLLLSKPLMKEIGSGVFTSIALVGASLAIFAQYFFLSLTEFYSFDVLLNLNQASYLLIIFIAIFCTVIPSFCTTAAVARIGADRTSITAMLGPPITSIFAVFILLEAFTIYHLIGMALILLGIAALDRKPTE